MEVEIMKQDGSCHNFSVLLELAASNDLSGFRSAVEEEGFDVDEASLWYGRRSGLRTLGFENRTPLMIAAMFGSIDVLKYIIETGRVDVNRACGSDGATALHCATAGGSACLSEVLKLLLDASADPDLVDASGNRPGDLIAPVLNSTFSLRKRVMLKDSIEIEEAFYASDQTEGAQLMEGSLMPWNIKDGSEKKEYPVDISLPDIKKGIYGTDEFRMYTFKVRPCSRAYSHDWTECPFVHPGENARRRDPRKYHYSCVPCPEFRKGSCRQGDACEYAHGIFECWLHPAQYRTRLCKDETGCTRRVCFFAHKPEELRPLYASTGSAVPSPRSFSANASALDIGSLSPLSLCSSSTLMPPTSTPPMTPSGASSPLGGNMWHNQSNLVPPTLQLPGSRLKASRSARDMDYDMELLELETYRRRQQQQLMDDISSLSSPSSWSNAFSNASAFPASPGGVRPTNLEHIFDSLDPSVLPQLQGLILDGSSSLMQSPSGIQARQNMNQQLRSSYPASLASSPIRPSPSFGMDSSGAMAAAVMNSRSAAFAKGRSQSFIERSAANRQSGFSSSTSPITTAPSPLSDWGSPDGKLDWGIQGADLNKLRKSASFGLRSSTSIAPPTVSSTRAPMDEPDVSWVQSLVKESPSTKPGQPNPDEEQQYHLNSGKSTVIPAWVEQLYMEQEQMVA